MLERVPHDEGSRDPAFAPRSETIRARMAANAEDPSPMGSPPVRGQGAGASGMTRRVFERKDEKKIGVSGVNYPGYSRAILVSSLIRDRDCGLVPARGLVRAPIVAPVRRPFVVSPVKLARGIRRLTRRRV